MKFKILSLLLLMSCNLLNAQTLISQTHVPKQPFIKYTITTRLNDTITFYLSEFNKQDELPLVIFVQGSGRHSLFTKNPKDSTSCVANYGTGGMAYIVKDKARLLIVDKPGVEFLRGSPDSHDPASNKKFDDKFSLQSWSSVIEDAIKYVLKHQPTDPKKIMIMGHSEGGVVAAKVADDLKPLITNVTILAGEGASQLYSLYSFARSGDLFDNELHNKPENERIDSLISIWNDILKYPSSTDKLFFGYTYLRWYSFLSTSVSDELENFKGKIFIAQGKDDKNVSPESAVILYTSLLSKGKNVTLLSVENADHSFYIAKGRDEWPKVLSKAVAWLLN